MRETDSGGTRGRLIAAAAEVITDGNHISMPLRTVAQRAGATTGAIQHHFGNRNGLLLAVLAAHGKRTADRLRARRDQGSGRPGNVVRAILLEYLPLDEERREEALVAYAFESMAINDNAMAAAYRAQYAELADLLAEHLPFSGPNEIDLLLAALGGFRTDLLLNRVNAQQAVGLLDLMIERISQKSE